MSEDGLPKKPPATAGDAEEWREIAQKAANEKDPKKLIKLVENLCDALEEQNAARKRLRRPIA